VRVRIAQCLCGPRRHAILGMAWRDESLTDREAIGGFREVIRELLAARGDALDMGIPKQLDPWCGLCGAPEHEWTYEIGWSIEFADWEAAERHLRESEAQQAATRLLLRLRRPADDA
jgi:hypothetical protein